MSDLISRAEALHRLSYIAQKQTSTVKAVKAMLETLPSIQPETEQNTTSEQPASDKLGVKTCKTWTDAISRQAAIDTVSRGCEEWRGIYARCETNLLALPSVQPKRKIGKWVEHHEPFTWMGYAYWTCSECNFGEKEENKTRSNYCPNCGARMEKSEDIPMEYFESGGR